MKTAAALLVVVLAGSASATALGRRTPAQAERQLGVSLPWSGTWLSDLDAYSTRVGRVPAVVQTYRDMEYAMLNTSQMDPLVARGVVPLVTVEPWDSSSTTDPRFALKTI